MEEASIDFKYRTNNVSLKLGPQMPLPSLGFMWSIQAAKMGYGWSIRNGKKVSFLGRSLVRLLKFGYSIMVSL